MSKQEQIDELKKALEVTSGDRDSWRQKAEKLEGAKALRIFNERIAAEAKRGAERAVAENATIRQIENGLIPVAELRKAWHATQQDVSDGTAIEFRFSPVSGSRIQSAVLKALTEPAKSQVKIGWDAGGNDTIVYAYPAGEPTGQRINFFYDASI